MTDKALNSLLKLTPIIESTINMYGANRILCSISGGSDSDILFDYCTKISKEINYVYFDTGLEYQATKNHINYLMNKYDCEIKIKNPKITIPLAIKKYGYPFYSKSISDEINRLQCHDFDFGDHSFEEDILKYNNVKQALRWYHNDFGKNSRYNIDYVKGLKKFLIENPPQIIISNKCCDVCKKSIAKKFIKDNNIILNITGVRKFEGGARNRLNSCYDQDTNGVYQSKPLLWFTKKDKEEYNKEYNIINSNCYNMYGLKRTGCVGCPFGDYKKELEIVKKYEPKLYNACNNIFKKSYEYSDLFDQYRKNNN